MLQKTGKSARSIGVQKSLRRGKGPLVRVAAFPGRRGRKKAAQKGPAFPFFPRQAWGRAFFSFFSFLRGKGAAFPPLPERRGIFFWGGAQPFCPPLVQAAPGMGEEPPPAQGEKSPAGWEKGEGFRSGAGGPVPHISPPPGGAR